MEFGSSKFHCDREVVSVYRANRGEIPKTEIKFPSARQPDLLKRLRQCNEWRGVKFDSIERRQKGGEGFLLPNVARSENQPSNVSYIYIYIYIYICTRSTLRSPRFLDDRDTSPPHDSFTRTIARFLRTKKKKAPVDLSKVAATTTVLRRVAWGQGAPPTFSPRYRDCENGTDHAPPGNYPRPDEILNFYLHF